jgi:hypothetical protein
MRPIKPLILALSLAALLALVAAGCGGGGDDTTESAPATVEVTPLTKAELISQGDAICGETNASIGVLGASEAEVPEQIEKTADLYIGMVERIKDLGAPEEAAGYDEFIAAAEELSTVQSEAKLASEREDTAVLGEVASKSAPVLEEFAAVAGDYGFEQCSEGPSAPAATGAGTGVGTEEVEEGGVEVAPEELEEEVVPEEVAPEEVAPETGGAGGGAGAEVAPEAGGGTSGGSSGGVGPG